jgi:trans-2,3-dihydro-3-hydroxyanthranilate isomerase
MLRPVDNLRIRARPAEEHRALTQLDFLLIDVFTDRPFGGSRLTVFPRGADLPHELMQHLAHEMGPGETAFVLGDPAPDAREAALRVFTPEVELPFAGHAILGATFALDALGRRPPDAAGEPFTWDLEAGHYTVATRDVETGRIYSMRHDTPSFLGEYYHRGNVARAIGLDESELAITGLPCEIISTGLPIHIVPVGSLAAVKRAQWRRRESEPILADLGFADFFLFTFETESPEATVHCRMFAPYFGIPEDPASGAAFGSLAAYLVKHRLARAGQHLAFLGEQGLEMGRPSRLFVEADIQDGRAVDIHVGGHCVLLGRGQIELP